MSGEIVTRPNSRAVLLEAAVVLNAAWTAYCLRKQFHAQFPELGVVYGAYDLVTRRVRLPLSSATEVTEEEKGCSSLPKTLKHSDSSPCEFAAASW